MEGRGVLQISKSGDMCAVIPAYTCSVGVGAGVCFTPTQPHLYTLYSCDALDQRQCLINQPEVRIVLLHARTSVPVGLTCDSVR